MLLLGVRFTKFSILLVITARQCLLATCAAINTFHAHDQAYLDVEPANTARFLDIIRDVNISTYRLSYERSNSNAHSKSKNRLRMGPIGPELVEMIPEAVELVPKRILPPLEKGGEPVVLHNIPVVNENILFMFGVGATQELIGKVDALNESIMDQFDEIQRLVRGMTQLEHSLSMSSSSSSNRMKAELLMNESIAEAEIVRYEMERELQRFEQENAYLELQRQLELDQIHKSEQLTLARLAQEEEAARKRSKEEMMLKFESNREIERSRAHAAEELSMMQHERDVALQKATEEMAAKTAKAIAEAKAEAERANEDVHLRKLKAEAEQSRKKSIAAINAVASHIASSLYSASKNPRQVLTFIWYLAILATGIYSAREVAQLCRTVVESVLGKPKLIRETTRKSIPHQLLSNLMEHFYGLVMYHYQQYRYGHKNGHGHGHGHGLRDKLDIESHFQDVALEPDLKDKILSIAIAASKVRKNEAPHRHTLFFGPPGVGKTMVAKKLATSIGMDYALMSGGDVGPLGADAVTQIHNLFRWAKFSKNGVLLFIDEAEAFLGDRRNNSMSENAHNALNALLYNTGGERRDFMMVLATNRAEDLDAAILDRCDESLLFPLPSRVPRSKLVEDYFNLYVRSMIETKHELTRYEKIMAKVRNIYAPLDPFHASIEDNAMSKEMLESIVEATAGFSGREIAKLMIALQGSIYSSVDGLLTSQIIQTIVATKVEEHHIKLAIINRDKNSPADETKRLEMNHKPTQALVEIEYLEEGNIIADGTPSLGELNDDLSYDDSSQSMDDDDSPTSDISCTSSENKEKVVEEKSNLDISNLNCNGRINKMDDTDIPISDLSSTSSETEKKPIKGGPKQLDTQNLPTPTCACELM